MVHALFLNCTLKPSGEESNTEALINELIKHFDKEGVTSEILRLIDYNIAFGVTTDEGEGDEWPLIFEKVKKADIVVLGTPIWLGEKSSIAKMVIERLYGASSMTNEKGQYLYYNKVGGVVVTGNEDGAKQASASILYSLAHIGFTIPPNVDTYWVGDAGPGPSFIEAEGYKNEFTQQHARVAAYTLLHFARMLKVTPIPEKGTRIE